MLGINTPAKINAYKDYEELQDTLNLAYEIFNKITLISPQDIIYIIRKFEDRYDKGVDKCMLFLNMLISLIENNIKEKNTYSYMDYVTILLFYKSALNREPTLRRRMLLYKIFFEFYNLRVDVQ